MLFKCCTNFLTCDKNTNCYKLLHSPSFSLLTIACTLVQKLVVMTTTMLTFGMGASTQALFARVGGGIYTKAGVLCRLVRRQGHMVGNSPRAGKGDGRLIGPLRKRMKKKKTKRCSGKSRSTFFQSIETRYAPRTGAGAVGSERKKRSKFAAGELAALAGGQ